MPWEEKHMAVTNTADATLKLILIMFDIFNWAFSWLTVKDLAESKASCSFLSDFIVVFSTDNTQEAGEQAKGSCKVTALQQCSGSRCAFSTTTPGTARWMRTSRRERRPRVGSPHTTGTREQQQQHKQQTPNTQALETASERQVPL